MMGSSRHANRLLAKQAPEPHAEARALEKASRAPAYVFLALPSPPVRMIHVKRSPGALERPAAVELIPPVRPFWECDTGLALQLQAKTGLKAVRF